MVVDSESFRLGMRRLRAGVCLITTSDDVGVWGGMTATAVCSVSSEPPTLLCCINRTAATYQAVQRNGCFAVNVLALHDRELADRFAGRRLPVEKFETGDWTCPPGGSPQLASALVSFQCRVAQTSEVATHGVMFGEIQAIGLSAADTAALLYGGGGYGSFSALEVALRADHLWMPAWSQD